MILSKYKKMIAVMLSFALMTASLAGCTAPDYLDYDGFFFDTYITIRIYGGRQAILDEAARLCSTYDRMFDRNDEKSDVWRLNHSDGQPVQVSPQTADLLLAAMEYSRISDGRFDVTCGAVTALWDFTAESPVLPDTDALARAVQTVGTEKINIEGSTVTLEPGTQIDLGGIAKGYIADRLVELLKSRGIENAVINLGGNVVVVGDKFGKQYRIGISSPFGPGNIAELTVSDCSVVTAGTYQRGFELDGVYYHHILDLATGMSAASDLAAVTVITETSEQGDAMATTLFLMGLEKGLEMAESIKGLEAVFVTNDREVIRTSGIQ